MIYVCLKLFVILIRPKYWSHDSKNIYLFLKFSYLFNLLMKDHFIVFSNDKTVNYNSDLTTVISNDKKRVGIPKCK